jgi:hypothetical protein
MELTGKRFPFRNGHIEFTGEHPHTFDTPWGGGTYEPCGERQINIFWRDHCHRLTFNADYTWYYSIRIEPLDYEYSHGAYGDELVPTSPWVSCQLAGGIGNRLFQLAAALGLAEQMGRRVVFYTPVNTGLTHQSTENILSLFPHIPRNDEGEDSIELYEPHGHEYTHGLDVPVTEKNILLFGYRQHMKYFPSYSLRPSFSCINTSAILSTYRLDTEEDKRKTWFIHIRLGDFTTNTALNHVTVESYHRHLLTKIPDHVRVIVISTDPESVLSMLQKYTDRPFILCKESDERACLYLMSQCWGGAIAANSTFSWWGSYLAYHSTPYTWEYKAYFPEEWIRGKTDAEIASPWAIQYPVTKTHIDIIGITICVNFDDILYHTIDQNAKMVKILYIITSPTDSDTINLLVMKNLPNVKVLYFDKFFVNNAKFNKGGAVRYGQEHVHALYPDANVLLLDADVILPETLYSHLPSALEPDVLYGVTERLDYHTLDDFLTRQNGNVCCYGAALVGFFQLYRGTDRYLYKDSDSCCTCDNDFRDSFPRHQFIELSIAHLGVSGVNWEGRDYTKDQYKK